MDSEERFDAIVIGSGFGGSVVAYRLAKAGQRVCVLERGRAYPPGSFPRSPYEMRRAFWDPSNGLYGMFSVWSFRHFGAVISSGLGGGSLIYANVMLRKDRAWFTHTATEDWPIGYADLEPHYVEVERQLNVQPFPFDRQAPGRATRTAAFMDAATSLGWEPFLPPLAVTFAQPGAVPGDAIPDQPENLHGSRRSTCLLVGECDIGCNYGAKNSLDYTYLSRLDPERAFIRPLHEVRRFEPLPDGGYRVHYVVHNLQNENPQGRSGELAEQHGTMTAPRLVIAAGTLGSTYLLLRNRAAFPRLSDRLGTGFSGNGDLLTLALRPTRREGGATVRMPIDGGYGPAITAAVRFADTLDGPGPEGRGFYLEDAGYPDLLAWLMEAGELPMGLWNARHQLLRQIRLALRGMPDTDVAAELSALLGDQPFSAGALPMLGMGRDEPGGRMSLSGRTLQVDWKLDQSRPYFQRVRHAMEKMAGALGAQFMDNPMWHLGNRVITVHPLGGVPMGRDPEHGVVDSWGRAFGYDGLYVADGSIMPGAVGPNPSLTIAAMADRIATGMLGQAEEAPR